MKRENSVSPSVHTVTMEEDSAKALMGDNSSSNSGAPLNPETRTPKFEKNTCCFGFNVPPKTVLGLALALVILGMCCIAIAIYVLTMHQFAEPSPDYETTKLEGNEGSSKFSNVLRNSTLNDISRMSSTVNPSTTSDSASVVNSVKNFLNGHSTDGGDGGTTHSAAATPQNYEVVSTSTKSTTSAASGKSTTTSATTTTEESEYDSDYESEYETDYEQISTTEKATVDFVDSIWNIFFGDWS